MIDKSQRVSAQSAKLGLSVSLQQAIKEALKSSEVFSTFVHGVDDPERLQRLLKNALLEVLDSSLQETVLEVAVGIKDSVEAGEVLQKTLRQLEVEEPLLRKKVSASSGSPIVIERRSVLSVVAVTILLLLFLYPFVSWVQLALVSPFVISVTCTLLGVRSRTVYLSLLGLAIILTVLVVGI